MSQRARPTRTGCTVDGGLRTNTTEQHVRPSRAVGAPAPAVRRTPDRADSPRPPRRLRGALLALPVAAALLLPSHARLQGGRRGRAAGGLRRGLQRGARRRTPDQRAAVAVPDRAQPLAQPPAPRHRHRRGLDGHPLRRKRHLDERQGAAPRELPRADRRRPLAPRDAAHRAAAARDRRALLRPDRRGDGHDGAVGQVAARPRPHLARRGRRGAQAELRGSPLRARRSRRGPQQAERARLAATCAAATAAPASRSSSRRPTPRWPPCCPSPRC